MIRFTIPYASPSLNATLRMHWSEKARTRKALALEIWAQVREMPTYPRAHVTITRYGSRELDRDNFVGGCKSLIDVLKPAARSNPSGLGIIAGDDPGRLTVEYVAVKSTRADERTEVVVRELTTI
jgi:hypothetical protein